MYRSAHDVRHGQQGFTLVEVIVVAAVVSILLGVTVSGYRGLLAERKVERVAWEIAGALRLAQQIAVARAGEWSAVRVYLTDRAEVRGVTPAGAETTTVSATDAFPEGVRVTRLTGCEPFEVSGSGAPKVGCHGTIEIRRGSATRYVIITSTTGRVRVSTSPQ
jgi:prepilin-type N-terminal cleavage/methylation domain-containing protein